MYESIRVLIDTNVLISAALSSSGVPFQAYVKAATYPNHGLICEQNIDEITRIFNKENDEKFKIILAPAAEKSSTSQNFPHIRK